MKNSGKKLKAVNGNSHFHPFGFLPHHLCLSPLIKGRRKKGQTQSLVWGCRRGLLPALLLTTYHLSLTTSLFASTSANFLRETLSARQSGMGGVYSAVAGDSSYANPAALSLISKPELNLSYASARETARHLFFSYGHPSVQRENFAFSFGTTFSYYSAGNMDVNFRDGRTASFNAETSFAGSLSFGTRIYRWLALGISPQVVRSTLVEQFSGTAFAVNLGLLLYPFPDFFRERVLLGAVSRNLGTKINYRSEENDLPRTESAGISVLAFESKEFGSVLTSVQAEKVSGEKWRYRLGGEVALGGSEKERVFFLRSGHRIQFDSEDYSIGIGFRERNLQLDYALVNGLGLERTHYFTFLFRFGKIAETREPEEKLLKLEKEKTDMEKYQLIPQIEK